MPFSYGTKIQNEVNKGRIPDIIHIVSTGERNMWINIQILKNKIYFLPGVVADDLDTINRKGS
jgi:hypothetical protein